MIQGCGLTSLEYRWGPGAAESEQAEGLLPEHTVQLLPSQDSTSYPKDYLTALLGRAGKVLKASPLEISQQLASFT